MKWTTFDVDPGERDAFCAAAAAWTNLATARGFVAQAGGWLDAGRTKAGILSLWTDIYRYQAFMRRAHRSAKAVRTYASGRMVLAKPLLHVDGACVQLRDAIVRADSLRIADCSLERAQMASFLEDQRAALARASADGFLGGSLLRVQHDDPRFLVASFWEGEMLDAASLAATLPSYHAGVATQTASETIVAQRVRLVESWRVIAE